MFIKKATVMLLAITALSGCMCHAKKHDATNYAKKITQNEIATALDFELNVGDRVFFKTNETILSEKAKSQLRKQADWLMHHKDVIALIQGHCDERGSEEYNMSLGAHRARAVEQFLLEHGIASSRISIISYGKTHPVASGHNEKAWKQNRRGVTFVTIKALQDC